MVAPFAIYPKGTVSVRMLPIAKILAKKNYKVAIVIPPYDNLSQSGLRYEVDGVELFNIVFRDFKFVKYFLTPLSLIWKIFVLKPNVVYIFKPKGYSGLIAMFFALMKKFCFLKDFRVILDMDDWEGYGGFNDYYLKHSLYPRIMLNFFEFQERWLPKQMDAVTVASKTLEKRALEFGVSPNRIFYIPNGTTLQGFNVNLNEINDLRKNLGIEDAPIILLYTRFFEYNIEKVVAIVKNVKKAIGGVKLLVVGRGEFGEEEELKRLALREGIGDSVIFTGWIQASDLPRYLAVGDVAIYPFDDKPLNRAKCPGKLVELMLARKAIVADKVGQISEYIEEDESGILVDPNDIEMFAFRVIEILNDKALNEKLGKNAQKRVSQIFNWNKLLKTVEQTWFPKVCREKS